VLLEGFELSEHSLVQVVAALDEHALGENQT
jgi:hypothetical protein